MPTDDRARVPADISVPEMERLLGLALERGGQFADLYFEHHRTSSLLLAEGIIRTASAGVTCGLGVRVVSGERTGYAYTDDLSPEAMARAARTAAHIAADPRTVPPQAVSPAVVDRRYGAETPPGPPPPRSGTAVPGPRPSPCSTSPRASRSWSAPRAPPAPTTRVSR